MVTDCGCGVEFKGREEEELDLTYTNDVGVWDVVVRKQSTADDGESW
jgi:hypothetical protein